MNTEKQNRKNPAHLTSANVWCFHYTTILTDLGATKSMIIFFFHLFSLIIENICFMSFSVDDWLITFQNQNL